MIVLGAAVLGAGLGWLTAVRRGGNRLDKAQYAASFAIMFALIGLFVTIILARSIT